MIIIWFFSLYCAIPAPRSPSRQQQQYTFKDLLNMELRWNSDVENVVTAHSFQVSVEVCCTAPVLEERLSNPKLPLSLLSTYLNPKYCRHALTNWKFWFATCFIFSSDGFTNILTLRIYKIICCYLHSHYIRINKQTQFPFFF